MHLEFTRDYVGEGDEVPVLRDRVVDGDDGGDDDGGGDDGEGPAEDRRPHGVEGCRGLGEAGPGRPVSPHPPRARKCGGKPERPTKPRVAIGEGWSTGPGYQNA